MVDWRFILGLYLGEVIINEGTYFLGPEGKEELPGLDEEQTAALRDLIAEIEGRSND